MWRGHKMVSLLCVLVELVPFNWLESKGGGKGEYMLNKPINI